MQKSQAFYSSLFLGLIGALLEFFRGVESIESSTSSTAAIGYVFLLPYCIVVFMLCAGYSYLFAYALKNSLLFKVNLCQAFFKCIVPAALVLAATFYVGSYFYLGTKTQREISAIAHMNSQQIAQVVTEKNGWDPFGFEIFKLAAVAQNPNTSSATLDELAHINNPDLNSRQGSMYFKFNPKNPKGFSVLRLIAQNPNTDLETLNYLATYFTDYRLLSDIARNPKTSPDLLWAFYKRNDKFINLGLAYNRMTPAPLLVKLAQDPDAYVRMEVAVNPSTPIDSLKLLLADPQQRVRRQAEYGLKRYRSPDPGL